MRQYYLDPMHMEGRLDWTKRGSEVRYQWERLLHLASFLDEKERVLLETAVEQGGRVGRLARLTGRSPSGLRRQLRDIAQRLTRRELRAMLAHPSAFTPREKACIRDHLIRRLSLGEVAAGLDTTVYDVRKTLAAVRARTERLCTSKFPEFS